MFAFSRVFLRKTNQPSKFYLKKIDIFSYKTRFKTCIFVEKSEIKFRKIYLVGFEIFQGIREKYWNIRNIPSWYTKHGRYNKYLCIAGYKTSLQPGCIVCLALPPPPIPLHSSPPAPTSAFRRILSLTDSIILTLLANRFVMF